MDTHTETLSPTDVSVHDFRRLFDAQPLSALIFDRTTLAILEANPAAEQACSCSHDAFLTMTVHDLWSSGEDGRLLEDISARLRAEGRHTTAARHRLPEGGGIDVRISSNAIRYEGRDAALAIVQDITDCTRGEETRRESERLLQSSLDCMDDVVIYAVDRNYRYLYFNALHQNTLHRAYGTTPLCGASMLDCITREGERKKLKLHVDQALAGTGAAIIEEHGDKSRNYYEVRFKPIVDSANTVFGVIVSSLNINERLAAGKALHESEERFYAFMDASPALAWVKDSDGRFNYVNKSWERVYGLKRDDVIGKTNFDIFPFDVAEKFRTSDLEVQITHAGTEVHEESFEMRGRQYHWNSYKFQFRTSSGQRLLGGIAIDITRRINAEASLKTSEERFRLAADASHVMVLDIDNSSGLLKATHGLTELLGYDTTEAEQTVSWWNSRIHPDDLPRVVAVLQSKEKDPQDRALHYRMRHKDGRWLFVEADVRTLYDESERVVRQIGSVKDITKYVRATEEVKENKEKIEFAMQIAHVAWWEMDVATGNFVFNDAKTHMLGYPPERFKQYSDFTVLLHPDDYDPTMNALKELLCGSSARFEIEYRILSKAHGYKWFRDIGAIMARNANGDPMKVAGIIVNISEQKRKEEGRKIP
jgi:PAS domain S-box-containing protein